jgi:hypothetical protein
VSDLAAAFARVVRALFQAITSEDNARISTAARWYIAVPQLFLRNSVKDNRNVHKLKLRLQQFLANDFRSVVTYWRTDIDKALAKPRHQSPDTEDTRAVQAVKLVDKGFVSQGVGKINSKGLAHGPEVRAQMERKHTTTEEHDWPIPGEADINMGRLKEIYSQSRPVGGCGTTGHALRIS